MGIKSKLLILTVLFGLVAYSLYCPVPDGYSPESTRKLRTFLAFMKFTDFLTYGGLWLGIGSSWSDNNRAISSFLKGPLGIPGTDIDVKEVDHVFNGVPVRVFTPAHSTSDKSLPGFVWYHGGGWTIGDIDTSSEFCRRICKQVNAVVVSVDYRLAPEHVFPAAHEDCVTATKYFSTNAAQFNVDPTRIAVGGDSAGGNLEATVSLKLRDEDFRPPLKLQVLIVPVIQGLDFQLPSYLKNADGPMLTRRLMAYFTAMYLDGNEDKIDILLNNDHVSPAVKKKGLPFIDVKKLPGKYLVGYQRTDSAESGNETIWNEMKDRLLNPYFSPMMADRLDGLPPAYVFTAEHDPLRDEGILYARRLEESRVIVMHRHSDIGFHVLLHLAHIIEEGDALFRELIDFISTVL